MPSARASSQVLLEQVRQQWGGRGDLWVFGYASLIWRPEFPFVEQRMAHLHGWHRALRMRSRVNRGTPERPGLVFALLPGGACRGVVFRIAAGAAGAELDRLWQREMPNPVYDPRWLRCRTAAGDVRALAFTLPRQHEAHLGRLPDERMLDILRHAVGRYGSTLHYLVETAHALRARGINDRDVERLMTLADRCGLIQSSPAAARAAARSSSVSTSISVPGSSTSTPKAG